MSIKRFSKARVLVALAIPTLAGMQVTSVMPASSTFDPGHYKGPMGWIELPIRGESSLSVKDCKTGRKLYLASRNGVVQMPVGTFDMLSYWVVIRDSRGVPWSLSTSFPSQRLRVTVRANVKHWLDIGPPFTASIAISPAGRGQVSMNFRLVGRTGIPYTLRFDEPPGFEFLDRSGRVLWQGTFRYG